MAEEAAAETERVIQGSAAELARVREGAESAIAAVHAQLNAAQRRHDDELAIRDRAVELARVDADAANSTQPRRSRPGPVPTMP